MDSSLCRNDNEKLTYKSLNLPNKYLKYLFEPRVSLRKDGRKITKYFPENLEKSIEMIVTNGLGYEPIRSHDKRKESLTIYLGEIDLRKKENSLNMWEYATNKSLNVLIGSNYREILNKKKKEIEKIKSELTKNNSLSRRAALKERNLIISRAENPKKRKRSLLASIFSF